MRSGFYTVLNCLQNMVICFLGCKLHRVKGVRQVLLTYLDKLLKKLHLILEEMKPQTQVSDLPLRSGVRK